MKEIGMGGDEFRALGKYLGKVHFFSGLSVAEMDRIFAYIKIFEYEKGEFVFKRGGPGDALFILYTGLLIVKKKKFLLGTTVVAELKDGDIFGEMALLDRKSRSATVEAWGTSKVFVLLTSDFDRVVAGNPNFLNQMKSVSESRKFVNRSNS